jgi:hypothetical protein
MRDANWIPFSLPAVFLALTAPACGGSAIVSDGTDGGGNTQGETPARCLIGSGLDAGVVYTAALTASERDASPSAAIIQWVDDAGNRVQCGPEPFGCDASCPPGQMCSVAFITHSLVETGGTCL